MTAPVCECGHSASGHESDRSGSGITPCWSGDSIDSDGYPINRCNCREYTPALTAVTLVWEESTNLRDEDEWTSGEVTTYTVRLYANPRDPDDDEIDSDGFTADEADEADEQPYLDAENRLLGRYGLTRDSISEVVTPF